jgi:hypothetical protein
MRKSDDSCRTWSLSLQVLIGRMVGYRLTKALNDLINQRGIPNISNLIGSGRE